MKSILTIAALLPTIALASNYSECIIENSATGSYAVQNINATLHKNQTNVGKRLTLTIHDDEGAILTWKTRPFKRTHIETYQSFESGAHVVIQKFVGLKVGEIKESYFHDADSISLTKFVSEAYNKKVTCYK